MRVRTTNYDRQRTPGSLPIVGLTGLHGGVQRSRRNFIPPTQGSHSQGSISVSRSFWDLVNTESKPSVYLSGDGVRKPVSSVFGGEHKFLSPVSVGGDHPLHRRCNTLLRRPTRHCRNLLRQPVVNNHSFVPKLGRAGPGSQV